MACNCIGCTTSNPVIMQVIEEIDNLKILLNGLEDHGAKWTMINTECIFTAYNYKGTDVTYLWDFGDGTIQPDTDTHIRHNFTS